MTFCMCHNSSRKKLAGKTVILLYLLILIFGALVSNTAGTPDFLHFIFTLNASTELIINFLLMTPLALILLTRWGSSKNIVLFTAGPFLSVIIELSQNLIQGRTPSLRDVFLNSSGYILTIILFTLFKRITI